MRKVRAGQTYTFTLVGMDVWDSRALVPAGTVVRIVNLPGCPKANTMGHAHIQTLDGRFAGLVLANSLQEVSR